MSKDKNQKQLQISFEVEADLSMTGLEEHIVILDHEDYSDEVRNMLHTETVKIIASMESLEGEDYSFN
jgi:hypothetical protein|tara:strand:+ start:233 stop:436 length:204 start_codon:yes stop_codon:yes gene_type:complete